MKRLSIILLYIISDMTFASANENFMALGENPRITVSYWHTMGEQVYLNKPEDFYLEGRCFYRGANQTGKTVVLALTSKENERNSGPAFPNETEYKVFVMEINNPAKMTVQELKVAVYQAWYENLMTIPSYGPLKWKHNEYVSGEVHKFKSYYTTQVVSAITMNCSKLKKEIQCTVDA